MSGAFITAKLKFGTMLRGNMSWTGCLSSGKFIFFSCKAPIDVHRANGAVQETQPEKLFSVSRLAATL
jgi:hypothetical protein